jgi:hypothetical protein
LKMVVMGLSPALLSGGLRGLVLVDCDHLRAMFVLALLGQRHDGGGAEAGVRGRWELGDGRLAAMSS